MSDSKILDEIVKPFHIPDSHFGIFYEQDELASKINLSDPEQPQEIEHVHGFVRPWKDEDRNDVGSTVIIDEEKFEIILDCQQFTSEEISVYLDGDQGVLVEGHRVHKMEFGVLSVHRYFKRIYFVPTAFDCEDIKCKLSLDGIMMITIARRFPENTPYKKVAEVPVEHTGETVVNEINKRLQAIIIENE